jgi:serine/threonine protein phosphatase 1
MFRFSKSPVSPAPISASVPEGLRVYAIGDIHGREDCLLALLKQISAHRAAHPIQHTKLVFLGDYVDRGTGSHAVLEMLIMLQQLEDAVFLAGNHEWALLSFLEGTLSYHSWYEWGGDTTLASYGVFPAIPDETDRAQTEAIRKAFAAALPPAHHRFLTSLQMSETIGDYLFVHAGLRPGIPPEAQDAKDLIMIRDDFLLKPVTIDKTIIHGHTIFPKPHIRPRSIGIDTGAYASGNLTAIVLEGEEYVFLCT